METVPSVIAVRDKVIGLQTTEEKIKYCSTLIYETHSFLRSNGAEIPREIRSSAMKIIRFAEKELFQLIKK